jgi:hypothetical protein
MCGVHWLALIMLYIGLALSLTATALYVKSGVEQLRERDRERLSAGQPGS